MEPSTIEFPECGMVLLSGVNHDTGGSSGSGKSSVNAAIAYVLGFSPFTAVDSQSWHTEKPASVTLELETPSGPVVISRGKKTSLSVNGRGFNGSAKQIEEELDRVIGLPAEMRELLTYRRQKSRGLILSKKDAELKEFLMRLLGLDDFERELERSKGLIRDLEVKLAVANANATRLATQISGFQELGSLDQALAVVQEAEVELEAARQQKRDLEEQFRVLLAENSLSEQAAVTSFADQIAEAKDAVKGLGPVPQLAQDTTQLDKLRTHHSDAGARIEKLKAADKVRKTEIEEKRAALNREIQTYRVSAGEHGGLVREKKRLDCEIQSLTASLCPTCEREWDQAKARREDLESKVQDIERRIDSALGSRKYAEVAERELATLAQFEPNPVIAKLGTAQTKISSQIAAEQARLDGAQALVTAEHRQKITTAQSKVTQLTLEAAQAKASAQAEGEKLAAPLRAKISSIDTAELSSAVAYAKAEVTALRASMDSRMKIAAELGAAQAAELEITTELAAEKDFLGLYGREGFLAYVFDQALADISTQTNEILGSVANTAHCTFEFVSETFTEKGTAKKKIVPMITVGGHQASFDSGLSGGMQSAVELAVDLAFAKAVSERSGVALGFLIQDECFEGLDTVSKRSCFDVLAAHAHDRLVLVVDHNEEFKSIFTSTIKIEYRDGKSAVVG